MTKANVDAPRVTDVTTAPVFLPEALARALPDCKNNQHKVKVRLETLQREGDIRLLANGVPMAPGATPTMLGVEADTLHVGDRRKDDAPLEVILRSGRSICLSASAARSI